MVTVRVVEDVSIGGGDVPSEVSVATIIDVLVFTLFDGCGSEAARIEWNRLTCQWWTSQGWELKR